MEKQKERSTQLEYSERTRWEKRVRFYDLGIFILEIWQQRDCIGNKCWA